MNRNLLISLVVIVLILAFFIFKISLNSKFSNEDLYSELNKTNLPENIFLEDDSMLQSDLLHNNFSNNDSKHNDFNLNSNDLTEFSIVE